MIGIRCTVVMIDCGQSLCLVGRDLELLALVRNADESLKKSFFVNTMVSGHSLGCCFEGLSDRNGVLWS